MYTVLRNEFLDMKKRKSNEVEIDDSITDTIPAQDDVFQSYLKNEQLHWLYTQISQLPGLEREVMLLTVQTDYKDSRISQILGITIDHVRVLRHRAKAKILKASEEEKI